MRNLAGADAFRLERGDALKLVLMAKAAGLIVIVAIVPNMKASRLPAKTRGDARLRRMWRRPRRATSRTL
jgi:hypothetical protein